MWRYKVKIIFRDGRDMACLGFTRKKLLEMINDDKVEQLNEFSNWRMYSMLRAVSRQFLKPIDIWLMFANINIRFRCGNDRYRNRQHVVLVGRANEPQLDAIEDVLVSKNIYHSFTPEEFVVRGG